MHFDFLEIGTCDYDTESHRNVRNHTFKPGISVEMVKKYLDRLPSYPGHIKANYAVVPSTIYRNKMSYCYVDENDIIEHNSPGWIKGCNKIGGPSNVMLETVPPEIIRSKEVQCFTVEHVYKMYGISSLRLLKIDAEGLDVDIIQDIFDNNLLLPDVIYIEINQLANENSVTKLFETLNKRNIIYKKVDSINLLIKP